MNNKVSIIVPVYNVQDYLGNCLDSILRQSYENIEIILVNDGSTDSSGDICDQYSAQDNRILVVHQENMGVSAGRNKGVDMSTGYYITFVDSDDWLEEDAIRSMVEFMECHDVDCVRTHYQSVVNDYAVQIKGAAPIGRYDLDNMHSLRDAIIYGRMSAYTWLLMLKRDVLKQYGLRFDEELSMMEDTLFYIRLLNIVDSFYVSDVVTCNHLSNPESVSKSPKRVLRNAKDVVRVNEKLLEILPGVKHSRVNAVHVKIIATSLFMSYRLSLRGLLNTLNLASEIRHNTGYSRIVKGSDLSYLGLPSRMIVHAVDRGWAVLLLVLLIGKSWVNFFNRSKS